MRRHSAGIISSLVAVACAFLDPTPGRADSSRAPQWEEVSDSDGIKVFSKEIPGSDVLAFKGESTLDYPIVRVTSVLKDGDRQVEWMPSLKASRVLTMDVKSQSQVQYNLLAMPWPLSDRYLVTKGIGEVDKEKGIVHIKMQSTDDPPLDEPERVKAYIFNSEFVLRPADGGKRTFMVIEIHTDPKGQIPKFLVNFFQRSWPRQFFEALAKQLQRRDVKDDPLVAAALKGMKMDGLLAH